MLSERSDLPQPSDDLFGWGLDSLLMVELWERATDATRTEIDLDAFLRRPTLNNLLQLVVDSTSVPSTQGDTTIRAFEPSFKQMHTARRLVELRRNPSSPLGVTVWIPPGAMPDEDERLAGAFGRVWSSQTPLRLILSGSDEIRVLPTESLPPYRHVGEMSVHDAYVTAVPAGGFPNGKPLVIAVGHNHQSNTYLTVIADHLVIDRLGLFELGLLIRKSALNQQLHLEDRSLLGHLSHVDRERAALSGPLPAALRRILDRVGTRPRFNLAPDYAKDGDEFVPGVSLREFSASDVARWREAASNWAVSTSTLLLTAVSLMLRGDGNSAGVCMLFANRFGGHERTAAGWFASRLPVDLTWEPHRSSVEQARSIQRQVVELTTSSSSFPYSYLIQECGAQLNGPTLVVQVHEPLPEAASPPYVTEVEESTGALQDVHLDLILNAEGSAFAKLTYSTPELEAFLDRLSQLMTTELGKWNVSPVNL